MAVFLVRDGPAAGTLVDVAGERSLGRPGDEFLEHDGQVSRRHAIVREERGAIVIEDLGSANGTFVNGERISSPTPLAAGDVVRIGRTTFEVQLGEPEEAASPSTPAPGPGPLPAEEVPAYGPVAKPRGVADAPAYGQGTPPRPRRDHPSGSSRAARPAGIMTAATLLFVVAAIGIPYQGNDFRLLLGDLDQARAFGVGGLFLLLMAIDAGVIVAHGVQIAAGVMALRRRPAGPLLGVVSSGAVIVLWIANLVVFVLNQISFDIAAWAIFAATVVASAIAIALLDAARRQMSAAGGTAQRADGGASSSP